MSSELLSLARGAVVTTQNVKIVGWEPLVAGAIIILAYAIYKNYSVEGEVELPGQNGKGKVKFTPNK